MTDINSCPRSHTFCRNSILADGILNELNSYIAQWLHTFSLTSHMLLTLTVARHDNSHPSSHILQEFHTRWWNSKRSEDATRSMAHKFSHTSHMLPTLAVAMDINSYTSSHSLPEFHTRWWNSKRSEVARLHKFWQVYVHFMLAHSATFSFCS